MANRKYKVMIDVPRNRMYVILKGFLSAAEIEDVSRYVIEVLPRLRPGFDVVTDLTEAQGTNNEGLEELRKIQGYVATHGMRRAVRVVPPAVIALMQMWRTSRELGYTAEIAVSITDARTLLDTTPAPTSATLPEV